MPQLGRRRFVAGAAALPVWLLTARANATLMRGLSLRDLCAHSRHIALVKASEARCMSLPIAGRLMNATETRVLVEESLSKIAPENTEIVVRTLGGVLNGVGELAHGQAELALNARCVAFLTRADDGALWVTGMAQGHYPLLSSGAEPKLGPSPHLPTLRDFEHSAVRGLVGRNLSLARELIRRESAG